jgi:tRNA A37 N6-isopentenylltransferase MiaA
MAAALPPLPEGKNEVLTRAFLDLKPADAQKLKKIKPGDKVRVVIVGEVTSVEKSKAMEEQSEYDGRLHVTAQEFKLLPQSNSFQAMANEEDD